jgi:hypothetical protein
VPTLPSDLPDLPEKLPLQDILWHSFRQTYHADCANAAIHCASVRFSPLTFRIAEYLWNHFPSLRGKVELATVAADLGSYAEDPGRT